MRLVGLWPEGMTMTQTVRYTVTGEQKIHCAGCEERIRNALRRLSGIQDVQASAETQHVVVSFDPARVTPDQVRAKLEWIGYRVQPGPDRCRAEPLRSIADASTKRAAAERSTP